MLPIFTEESSRMGNAQASVVATAIGAGGNLVSVRSLRLAAGKLPRVCIIDESRIDEVCALEQRCYRSPWSAELIRAEFAKDISYRLALLLDERIAAYSFSYLIPEDLHLLNLAVAPEYRLRGLGKCLLANLMYRVALYGVRNVILEVRVSNLVARQLYQRLGFKQVGLRKCYYRDNGEDALVLERRIDAADPRLLERLCQLPALAGF
jgi:ribosomal-protein-alanine N-acetyltransferase